MRRDKKYTGKRNNSREQTDFSEVIEKEREGSKEQKKGG